MVLIVVHVQGLGVDEGLESLVGVGKGGEADGGLTPTQQQEISVESLGTINRCISSADTKSPTM
jgi:hypothetical protein